MDWMPVALALWQYRQGDYASSVAWGERALSVTPPHVVLTTLARAILSMASHKLGNLETARAHLKACRVSVEKKFAGPLGRGSLEAGYWFDWAYTHILLRQAVFLIEAGGAGNNDPE